jgi:hypothetical protein
MGKIAGAIEKANILISILEQVTTMVQNSVYVNTASVISMKKVTEIL